MFLILTRNFGGVTTDPDPRRKAEAVGSRIQFFGEEQKLRGDHGSGSVSESRSGRIQDADFGDYDDDDVMNIKAVIIKSIIVNVM